MVKQWFTSNSWNREDVFSAKALSTGKVIQGHLYKVEEAPIIVWIQTKKISEFETHIDVFWEYVDLSTVKLVQMDQSVNL